MPHRNRAVEGPSHFWDLVIRAGFLIGFVILVACLVIPLRPRLAEYRIVKEKGQALDAERAALQREIERRESELHMLERDPLFVEIKARDTLDMCKPGEVVFRFDDGGAGE